MLASDEIDDHTVLVPAPHVAIMDLDDGGLLVDEEAGRAYPTNATATLLWKLLDSMAPIGDLIDDVTAVFGSPRSVVADSVHRLVRTYGELGLFENVSQSLASVPVDIEYVDLDECGEPLPPGSDHGQSYDGRYLVAPPNA